MYKFLLLMIFNYVFADGVSSLELFLVSSNKNISADFTQTVYRKKNNQILTGTMKISRPNRFEWAYNDLDGNMGQRIINDGKKVYIIDKELEQVTWKKIKNVFDKSPAMILAGDNNIKNYYYIKNMNDDEIEWAVLTPRENNNNGFQSIYIGFAKTSHQLTQMKFVDSFGGKSQIKFTHLKIGTAFNKNSFQFVLPKGYDMLENAQN